MNINKLLKSGRVQLTHLQLLNQFPEPPAKVLEVCCDPGLMTDGLHQTGYEVTIVSPAPQLEMDAQKQHPDVHVIKGDFLDDTLELHNELFDVILFQESLQLFPDLEIVFHKAAQLLAENGKLIICDKVSYDKLSMKKNAVYTIRTIEQSFSPQGFYVQYHKEMGAQAASDCDRLLGELKQKDLEKIQIEQLNTECQTLRSEHQNKTSGYEVWVLRFSPYKVRGYQLQDEKKIVHTFNDVFHENRTIEHWRWKYIDNPQGGPAVSTAWKDQELMAHFSGYPLLISIKGKESQTYHVGDTFTTPACRGVGRGHTNMLSRVVRHYHKSWSEGLVDFSYGFNTGRIQKLGRLFLNYKSITPVFEYCCNRDSLPDSSHRWLRLLKGYRIEITENSGNWADSFFARVKNDYPILIVRNNVYLKWRYDQHPDLNYQYILLKHFGRIVAWWVIRREEKRILIIDALTLSKHNDQAVACLLEVFAQNSECGTMTGWFSNASNGIVERLQQHGFNKQRQFQKLDLCSTTFSSRVTEDDLAKEFYFTMGDSDLY